MRKSGLSRVVSYHRAGRLVPLSARGLRARTVVLNAGQCMDWHSTHDREELLIALRGQVRVDVASSRITHHRRLLAGHCLFIPQQTRHRVVNRSRRLAAYCYVTAPLP